jgi:hypothetical protein
MSTFTWNYRNKQYDKLQFCNPIVVMLIAKSTGSTGSAITIITVAIQKITYNKKQCK